MTKIPCSVPILTLNSGKYLARCLESVRDFEDVFIVDGNSTDDTQEIARRFGVPIYKQVETDEPNVRIANFTEVRSRAYGMAKTDWIFVLDSDEYITEALRDTTRSALEKEGSNPGIAFLIEKKMIIGEKKVEYSFIREIAVRLFHTKSGIGYITGKLVHEKLHIPENVKTALLPGVFYSQESPSYSSGIAKDDYYLSLTREKALTKKSATPAELWRTMTSMLVNFLRAVKILLVSCGIYLRHGYARSLPLSYVWRYARYHLLLSRFRGRQVLQYVFFR